MADRVERKPEKGFPETNLHMLESQLLTDVTLLVGDARETIQAHKFILVSRSPVFETMLCGPWSETDSVEIPDITGDVFKNFLRILTMADRVERKPEKGFPETNLHMLESQLLTDVTLLVGDARETIQAHKFILVSRSPVFETMLCGPWSETDSVEIPDITGDVFKNFLRYLYTDEVSLDMDSVLSLFYAARKYSVLGLEKRCVEFCISVLSPLNACVILQQAFIYDEEDLKERTMALIRSDAKACLMSDGFCDLNQECLNLVLQEDEMRAEEVEVFKAAMAWAEAECRRQEREVNHTEKRAVLGKSMNLIRFSAMCQTDLSSVVCPTGVLSNEELVTLFRRYTDADVSVHPFVTKARLPVIYRLSRSCLTPTVGDVTKRKDAISLKPNKCVSILSVFLYAGNLSFTSEHRFKIIIEDECYTKLTNLSGKVTVCSEREVFQVMMPKPVPIQADKQVTMRVTCSAPKRNLCRMNRQSRMECEESRVTWTIRHSNLYSECEDSLVCGLITGLSFCVKRM